MNKQRQLEWTQKLVNLGLPRIVGMTLMNGLEITWFNGTGGFQADNLPDISRVNTVALIEEWAIKQLRIECLEVTVHRMSDGWRYEALAHMSDGRLWYDDESNLFPTRSEAVLHALISMFEEQKEEEEELKRKGDEELKAKLARLEHEINQGLAQDFTVNVKTLDGNEYRIMSADPWAAIQGEKNLMYVTGDGRPLTLSSIQSATISKVVL